MSSDDKKTLHDLTLIDSVSTSPVSRTVKKNISIKFKQKQTDHPAEQAAAAPTATTTDASDAVVSSNEQLVDKPSAVQKTKPVESECKKEEEPRTLVEKCTSSSRHSPSTSSQSSSTSSEVSDDKRIHSKSDSRSSQSDGQSNRQSSSRHRSLNLSWDYGMRCRHVFCLDCAKKSSKNCPKCDEPIQRVENIKQAPLFICNYGAAGVHRQEKGACRKSYLTEHDLFSHMRHRHRCGDKELAENYIVAFFPSSDYMSMPVPPDFRLLGYCPTTQICPSLLDTQRFMAAAAARAPLMPPGYAANVTPGPPITPFALPPSFQNVQLPFMQPPHPPQFALPIPHLRY